MGYYGKIKLKNKAIELRKKGFSIKDIEKKLKVSRSSVSIWVRGVTLTQKQLEKLYLNKRTGALKGCIVAARNKIKKREELTHKLVTEGKKEIGAISVRDNFIAGVAMYFAEGNKGDKDVAFTNSESSSVKFMVHWFRNFCKVPNNKFRCSIYIHDNLNETQAKIFWSKLLKIPLSQFRKSYIVKNNPKRFRKTKNQYGVIRVTISDVNLQRKIMGWIFGLIN